MTEPSRSPTMDHVARRAGVSRALVSLVMRNSPKVSAAKRRAVLDAARELGYRPNAAARRLAQGRSSTMGVVINDLHNTFFADVVDGIHDEAEQRGYELLLNTAWRSDTEELRAIDGFLEHRVDGIILLGSRVAPGRLTELARDVPLVVIGTEAPGVDVVVNDDRFGGSLAARHLLALGHTSLAHIDGGSGAGASRRRLGFVEAVEAAGLEPVILEGDFTEESGVRGAEQLLARRQLPTAIFAANDLVAVGVVGTLALAGVQAPDDVSVVGYDNTALAALNRISLTTVNQPRRAMGRMALRCAIERLTAERTAPALVVLEPDMVVRRTSGPPPSARRPAGSRRATTPRSTTPRSTGTRTSTSGTSTSGTTRTTTTGD